MAASSNSPMPRISANCVALTASPASLLTILAPAATLVKIEYFQVLPVFAISMPDFMTMAVVSFALLATIAAKLALLAAPLPVSPVMLFP